MNRRLAITAWLAALVVAGCWSSGTSGGQQATGDGGTSSDTDVDVDSDTDADADSDTDTDTDTDTDSDTDTCDKGAWEGDVELGTLAELAELAGHTSITGDLSVGVPWSTSEIDDLSPLACLAEVGGTLAVCGLIELSNLDGLEQLEQVGLSDYWDEYAYPSLVIVDNQALVDVDALAGLSELPGRVRIADNPSLVDIDGLANVASIGEDIDSDYPDDEENPDLNIDDNASLENLDGLAGLSSIGSVFIHGNDNLVDIQGLCNVDSVDTIEIRDNASLESYWGLFGLTSAGTVRLIENESVTDLHGLETLTEVGNLHVTKHSTLESLVGLDNLTAVAGDLELSQNHPLPDLTHLDSLESVGWLIIRGNPFTTSLEGLDDLQAVTDGVLVCGNTDLEDIEALYGLTEISTEAEVEIRLNQDLPTCDVEDLVGYLIDDLGWAGWSLVCGNQDDACDWTECLEYDCY